MLVRASGCANTYPATVAKLARDAASYLGLGDVEGDVDGAIEGSAVGLRDGDSVGVLA